MTAPTIVILVLLSLSVAGAVWYLIKNRGKSPCSFCSGGCPGCKKTKKK